MFLNFVRLTLPLVFHAVLQCTISYTWTYCGRRIGLSGATYNHCFFLCVCIELMVLLEKGSCHLVIRWCTFSLTMSYDLERTASNRLVRRHLQSLFFPMRLHWVDGFVGEGLAWDVIGMCNLLFCIASDLFLFFWSYNVQSSGTLTFWDIVRGCTKMHNGREGSDLV